MVHDVTVEGVFFFLVGLYLRFGGDAEGEGEEGGFFEELAVLELCKPQEEGGREGK